MNDLEQLGEWLTPHLNKLGNAARRRLTAAIARDLRRSNQQRIKQQVEPDGTPFAPRAPLRSQRGRLRRKGMFTKLRQTKHLRISSSPNAASVQLLSRAGRIAAVHHYGLRDKVTPDGPEHHYPSRELLGFSRVDQERILDQVYQLIGSGK
ncbi:phage virion morphogenesis protein [Marinimicrobium sp. ARAG 43.8]|uniref:phage virion morphogenesis protein n=1 Tax=Marinimicrobium sp. ARAG 43.8 TaxID=3418719 RepID=UPI003CF6C3FE